VIVDLGPFGVSAFGTTSSWTCGNVGPATEEQIFHEAFCNYADMGLIMVAAAGDTDETSLLAPAHYVDEVITVAASDLGGTRFTQSNYGPDIAVSAPGGDLITTADGNTYKEVDLLTEAGTGIASPHVSGAIALCLAQTNAVSDVDWVRDRLAFDPGKLGNAGKGQNSTKGLLDVPTFVENCYNP
jgi:subtilisin family serine protease